MRVFKTWRDPYDQGFNTTKRKQIEIQSGLTVLVGCNGAGKSTLIQNIKDNLDKENIPYLILDNSSGRDRSNLMGDSLIRGDFSMLATSMCSSEGENISLGLSKFMYKVHEFLRTDKKIKENLFEDIFGIEVQKYSSNERWLLLDGVDSGYSIDNVVMLKEVFNLIKEDAEKLNKVVYIVISANEYELANGENCFDVMEGKYIKFKDYEDFKKFILHSSEKKQKREDKVHKKNEASNH